MFLWRSVSMKQYDDFPTTIFRARKITPNYSCVHSFYLITMLRKNQDYPRLVCEIYNNFVSNKLIIIISMYINFIYKYFIYNDLIYF